MEDEKSEQSWLVTIRQTLAFLFLPLLACIALGSIVALVESWGRSTGIIYMRLEPLIFSLIPFGIAIAAALIAKWTRSKKAARKIFVWAVCGVIAFIGTSAVFETIKTKPIVAVAQTFKELPGLTRELGTNGDKFSPATSGFVPCIDFIGFGCPNITRTWDAPPERELTVADLQKVLDDSGWKDVKIKTDDCKMADPNYPDCTAEGIVGQYKATVRIVKLSDHWELRMYLRLPTNVR